MARPDSSSHQRSFRPFVAIGLIIGVIVCVGSLYFWFGWGATLPPDEFLSQARRERKMGNYLQAEKLALRAFELDPKLNDALVLAGECAAAQSDWSRALEHFGRIKSQDFRLKLSNRLREADILHRHLHQLARAGRGRRVLAPGVSGRAERGGARTDHQRDRAGR